MLVRLVLNNMKFNLFKNKDNIHQSGFTLIEIMVATSIFLIIMLVALGALVSSSNAAKKAQALRSAMDNVNFAMESMTRSLRMGSDYSCVPFGTSVFLPASNNADCVNGGGAIIFTPANNPIGSHPAGSRDTAYVLKSRQGSDPETFVLQRCDPSCVDMISPNVNIDKLTFFVKGTDVADTIQPSVYILMKGTVIVKGIPNSFAIQTMASQRSAE